MSWRYPPSGVYRTVLKIPMLDFSIVLLFLYLSALGSLVGASNARDSIYRKYELKH